MAVTYVPVGADGIVDPDEMRRALRPDTVLVSVMHANNELGTVQPVAEIAAIAHEAGAYMHVDGVQALGKIPVDVDALGVDLYSMSGHKIYAPKGVGALYVRRGTRLGAVQFGGHHEREKRPGTENVPGAAAFGMAAELASSGLETEMRRVGELRDRLESAILERIPHTGVNGHRTARTPNTTNIYFDGSGRRGAGDRARPARLCGIQRRGLLERRRRAIARAYGHRTDGGSGARQHPFFAGTREHRRTSGRIGGGCGGMRGAFAQAVADGGQLPSGDFMSAAPIAAPIAVAMSGGVDSSTVAALLARRRPPVVGLTMQLWNQRRLPGAFRGRRHRTLLLARRRLRRAARGRADRHSLLRGEFRAPVRGSA